MIEKIRTYFKSCPYLKHNKINVDYLGEQAIGYTLDSIAAPLIIKKYAGGDTLRQFVFAFNSREPHGADSEQNLQNSSFYEQLAAWLEAQSENGNLPELDENKIAQKIEVLGSGQLIQKDIASARYQIKCRLIYYQKGY